MSAFKRVGSLTSGVRRVKYGAESVQIVGVEADWCPGLIIHRTLPAFYDFDGSTWTISHASSGTACIKCIDSLANVLVELRLLHGLCDWTLSADDIDRLPHRNALANAFNRGIARYTDAYRLNVGRVSEISRRTA